MSDKLPPPPPPPPAPAGAPAAAMPPPPPPPAGVMPPPPPPPPAGAPMPPPPPPGGTPTPGVVATAPKAPALAPAAATARSIRKMDAVCVDVVRRNHDTSTLYFFVGDTGPYKAGQFVTVDPNQFPDLQRWIKFMEVQKGKKEGIRAYSMSSAPGERCISITVKGEAYHPDHNKYPPLLSPFLASGVLKGRECTISGFSGQYCLKDDHADHTDQILHLASGSGVVPNYAIIKDELKKEKNAKVKHTLVFVNKTYADITFCEQFEALAKAFPERLEVIHCITREENPERYGPNFRKGRPDTELVKSVIRDLSSIHVFACGSAITRWEKQRAKEDPSYEPRPKFGEWVDATMKDLQIPRDRIKKEVFG